MILYLLAAVLSTASANVGFPLRPGVNLSGCEFADDAALCPKPADIDSYAGMGFAAIRLPVRSRQLDAAIPRLQPTVARALRRGMVVVIDLHDYAPLDPAVRVPLIKRVAAAFGSKVWIDYDNEPKPPTGTTGDKWVASAVATNDIIAGVRAAGVTNVLVVEWPGFSGNHRFPDDTPDGKTCWGFACGLDRTGGIKDPLGKTVLGPHRYYDKNKSGQSASCAATAWYWSNYLAAAEARGYKTLIGETAFGGADHGVPASCAVAAASFFKEVRGSRSVVAFTVWGGGAVWNSGYPFRLPPTPAAARSDYVRLLTGG